MERHQLSSRGEFMKRISVSGIAGQVSLDSAELLPAYGCELVGSLRKTDAGRLVRDDGISLELGEVVASC